MLGALTALLFAVFITANLFAICVRPPLHLASCAARRGRAGTDRGAGTDLVERRALASSTLLLGLLLVVGYGIATGDEASHPADLDGDGKVSPDEFVEFAAKQVEPEAAAGTEEPKLDADGDGQVSTEEFVAFAEKQAAEEDDMGPRSMTAGIHESERPR